MTSSISIFFQGGLFLRKIAEKAALGIVRTNLCKWLTYFVNIHVHSSIRHTMRNSRFTKTIANKNEETTHILFKSFVNKNWQTLRSVGEVTQK